MIGISACLGGISCRYDGGDKTIPALKNSWQKVKPS